VIDMTDSDTTTLTAAEERVARPRPQDAASARVWDIAATVNDPDIPVLSIEDLGVLRSAEVVDGAAVVSITPTYSGCPCVHAISDDLVKALHQAGYEKAVVQTVLAPAWTSDWLSEHGRQKLLEYGIAPPTGKSTVQKAGPARTRSVHLAMSVKCPQCGSLHTKETSRFGATLCKALYVCQDCQEPFEYFKVY
jgi:ring-1,2-phenylacetyl-CoA epoxidase subunit PaaD